MSDYIVSARKYRPTTFESVVGQKALTETLRNAIRQNHLAHAYLFCGPRGVGKTTCARIFAKTINCLHPTADHDACNECESCVAFNEQRSFNIHELDAASNNSVEDIRTLIQEVRIPPQIGQYSVYIIDEVHMLSQGAFNALLKTLEEPPSYAVFILATTEKHKVLPTILSRCQVYDFQRITIMDIVGHLQYVARTENIDAEEEALRVVAEKADGGMRDALSIFDQLVAFCGQHITYAQAIEVLNVLDTDYYFRLTDYALNNKIAEALLLLDEVLQKGFDAGHFIIGLMQHLRNVLVAKDAVTLPLLESSETIIQQFKAQAQKCDAPWLFRSLDILNSLDIAYRTSKNKRLTIEIALVKWCQPEIQPLTQPKVQPQAQPQVQQQVSSTPVAAPVRPQPVTQASNPSVGMPKLPSLNIKVESSAAVKVNDVSKEGQQNAPFTADRLHDVWAGLRKSFQSEDRLTMMLTDYTPELGADSLITLTLDNPWQKEELMKFENQIVAYLCEQLHNDSVRLHIQVAEYHKEQQAYTAIEKYKVLLQQNPHLQELKETLHLQLD